MWDSNHKFPFMYENSHFHYLGFEYNLSDELKFLCLIFVYSMLEDK